MGTPVTLKQAVRSRRGILLDTNVLPHFLTAKERQILGHFGVRYKQAARKFEGIKARISRDRRFTSIVNVVECMGEKGPEVAIAQAVLRALLTTVQSIRCPHPTHPAVLSLYAERGHAFDAVWQHRSVEALMAIEDIEEANHHIWNERADADRVLKLLTRFVEPWATRDRGWADIYTAQTAIDHDLIVLTEDVGDFRDLDRVLYLTDYDMSGT